MNDNIYLDHDLFNSILPPPQTILDIVGINLNILRQMKPFQRSHYVAAVGYLTEYKPLNSSNLELVTGCLEAFHHFCELEEWEYASKILFIKLNTPTGETLHKQLETWGYYQEQVNIYEKIYQHIDSQSCLIILNSLGDACFNLTENKKADFYYRKALIISEEIQNQIGKALAYRGLGNLNCIRGNYQVAANYQQKVLEIARYEGLQYHMGKATQNLGNIYQSLKDFDKAIQFYQSSLAIYQEINDYRGQATCLLNLGENYKLKYDYELAIDFYQKSLEIFRDISDLRGIITINFNLGFIYDATGQIQKAQYYYQESLQFAKQLEELNLDSVTLNNLGNVCYHLGYLKKAANYYQQYLRRVNYPIVRGNIYNTLGAIYCYLGNFSDASNYFYQGLNYFQTLTETFGDDNVNHYLIQLQSNTLCNLGLVFNKMGDFQSAIDYSHQALNHYQHLPTQQQKQGQANTFGNLGISYRELGEYQQALEYFNQAYILAKELDDLLNQGVQLRDIGICYQKMGEIQPAIDYLQNSYQLVKQTNFLPEIYETLIALREVYQTIQEWEKSRRYANEARKLIDIFNCIT